MFVTMFLLSLLLLNLASVEAVEPFELIMGRLSAADRSDPDQARPAHIHIHRHTDTKTHTDSSSYRVSTICISIDSQSKKSQGCVTGPRTKKLLTTCLNTKRTDFLIR